MNATRRPAKEFLCTRARSSELAIPQKVWDLEKNESCSSLKISSRGHLVPLDDDNFIRLVSKEELHKPNAREDVER